MSLTSSTFAKLVLMIAIMVVSLGGCATYSGTNAIDDEESARRLQNIGVQLYTIRNELSSDFEGSLQRVADLGYTQVETAGLHGRDPREVRILLDSLGLSVVATHASWIQLAQNPDNVFDEAEILGAHYVVLPSLPPLGQKMDVWLSRIETMNEYGRAASARGLGFAFHNHGIEFKPIAGHEFYDVLLENIDRNHVKLELDLYWLAKAGKDDPSVYFREYPGGFPLLHLKDIDPETGFIADVGQGKIDFASIFAHAELSGSKYFIVEHDHPEDPFATLENSIRHLRELSF